MSDRTSLIRPASPRRRDSSPILHVVDGDQIEPGWLSGLYPLVKFLVSSAVGLKVLGLRKLNVRSTQFSNHRQPEFGDLPQTGADMTPDVVPKVKARAPDDL